LNKSHQEINNLLAALDAKFIPPGPSGSPERNPAVLPPGRNMYVMNPEEIPSRPSWELATKLINDHLKAELDSKGRYPRKIGFSLIPLATYGDYGMIESQILYLMGVRPVWDAKNLVNDVTLIPAEELGRPRIDVFISARNVYRDQLPCRMRLLDKAIRLVASLEEKDNYVYEHSLQIRKKLEEKGVAPGEALTLSRARMFGWAPGEITNSWFYYLIERSGEWDSREDMLSVYLSPCRHVYTEGMWGIDAPDAYNAAIQGTETVLRSWYDARSTPMSTKYAWWVDGTLSLAVKHITGKEPDFLFVDVRDLDDARMVDAAEAVQMDFRTRLFNPKWIQSMMNEGYAGADIMAENIENAMGWEIMRASSVTDANWEELCDVYVRDGKQLHLSTWFDATNPHAFQKMTGAILETIRKGYWDAAPETIQDIVVAYAESVARHGKPGGIREGGNKKLERFVERHLSAPGTEKAEALLAQYRARSAEMDVPGQRASAKEQVRGKKLARTQPSPEEAPLQNAGMMLGIGSAALLIVYLGYRRPTVTRENKNEEQ
jgi:cobaltochelatase CobN